MTERNLHTVSSGVKRHEVQFYDDEATLVNQIWKFLSPALSAGNAVIVIATKPRLDKLERRFARQPWSNSRPLNAPGQYVALDAEQTLAQISVGGWPNEKRFHAIVGHLVAQAWRHGYARIYAYGEMVALLCAEQKQEAAVRIEHFWNTLITRYPLSLLCSYPMGVFSSTDLEESFMRICDAHTQVRPAPLSSMEDENKDTQRLIAGLQQKAAALESEVARHKQTEKALQQRERELSDFLENAIEGMHRVDADGTILWANKAELNLLGYQADEYIGHDIREFHTARDAIDDILKRLLHGETLYDYPARMRHKNGSIRHVLIHSNAHIVEGEFISTRCLTHDVTDRVLLEEELSRKREQLADIDRRKDEFLAMLGHELRNLLAPIMASLELMRLREDDSNLMSRARETIGRQVALMTRLVDDLLDVCRITRGKIELKREHVALGQVIERAVEITRPLIDERGHRLALHLPPEPVTLHADPARLAQVLANLMHNAAKYTSAGGRITVYAGIRGDSLTISVADNGIGLPPELLDKAFDLFVQGGNALASARGGLGTGLTLVRSLVRLHGGDVEAYSAGIGCGSKFVVTLPLNGGAATGNPRTIPADVDAPAAFEARSILIVDDNIDAAESLGECLKASGHQVYIVHDGASALHQAARWRPDIVILDIGMPAMDGYQIAHCLRSQVGLASSVLIAVTGYAQESDRISARQAGFDHHFAKPLDIDKLTGLIGQANASGD